MPIEPLSVEPVQPGQPITAQAWNEIVSNLADVINLLNAQAGQSLRVTVNNASANTDEIRVSAVAEGTGGAVFEAAKPVPPDTAFTLTGLPLKEALSALSTAGVVVARVLDVTGRDVAPANPPDAFLNSQVLAHLPDADTPVRGSQGAQLVISAALEVEPSVVVPSLAGLTLSESRKVLENLGLVLGDVQTRS
jgi:hypothetical protein